jgi:hypothetical protein
VAILEQSNALHGGHVSEPGEANQLKTRLKPTTSMLQQDHAAVLQAAALMQLRRYHGSCGRSTSSGRNFGEQKSVTLGARRIAAGNEPKPKKQGVISG